MTKRKIDDITPGSPSNNNIETELIDDTEDQIYIHQKKQKQQQPQKRKQKLSFFKRRRKKIPKIVRDIILERQNVRCNICYILWNIGFELDHIMPLSCGGTNDEDNLQLLCVKCHKYKTTFIDDYIRNKMKKTSDEITTNEIVYTHREKYRKLNNINMKKNIDNDIDNLMNKINIIIENYNDYKFDNINEILSAVIDNINTKNNYKKSSSKYDNTTHTETTESTTSTASTTSRLTSIKNKIIKNNIAKNIINKIGNKINNWIVGSMFKIFS